VRFREVLALDFDAFYINPTYLCVGFFFLYFIEGKKMSNKKALIIGINAYKKAPLRGCLNDARSMRTILRELYGFEQSNIKMLLDADASSINIKSHINKLVTNARNGDSVVFFFAGHGAQVGSGVSGEIDGKDEVIVPFDMNYNSLITDNFIYENLVQPFENKDASLTAIFDCCHSGTIVRDIDFDILTGEPYIPVLNRCLPSWFFSEIDSTRELALLPINSISACQDNQTAADLKNADGTGVPRGAFSYALHKMLQSKPNITYQEIEDTILQAIKRVSPKHKQTPQLYSVDPNKSIFKV
jgi:hypothetical protein